MTLLLLIPFCKKSDPEIEKFKIIAEIAANEKSPFYIDFAKYPRLRKSLPIGIFDSGTGGLTVLDSILTLDRFNNGTREEGADGIPDFVSEAFIYLGDKANMPYGRYDSEGKGDFLKELIIKDVQFLLGRKYHLSPDDDTPESDKEPVKAIVIACNTATAFGLELTRKAVKEWGLNIELMGIIDAGAKSAVAALTGSGEARVIGVMATEGTCATGGYPRAVNAHFRQRFQHGDIAVVQQAGLGLAAGIDGDADYIDRDAVQVRGSGVYRGPGLDQAEFPIDLARWDEYNFETGPGLLVKRDLASKIAAVEINSVANYIKYHVTHLAARAAELYPGRRLGAVILGCTHYPFFTREIREHFLYLKSLSKEYDSMIPGDIVLVDPARSLAVELFRRLSEDDLLHPDNEPGKASRFFISVANPLLSENRLGEDGGFDHAYKYGRSINSGLEYVKRVPFSRRCLTSDVLNRIENRMPEIYGLIFKTGGHE